MLRNTAYQKGISAEFLASLYLKAKGYKIVTKRYKAKTGEIDLIAQTKKNICFIEVKKRSTLEQGLHAVTEYQLERIVRTSQYYLLNNPHLQKQQPRFDLIVIRNFYMPKHIKDIYDPLSLQFAKKISF